MLLHESGTAIRRHFALISSWQLTRSMAKCYNSYKWWWRSMSNKPSWLFIQPVNLLITNSHKLICHYIPSLYMLYMVKVTRVLACTPAWRLILPPPPPVATLLEHFRSNVCSKFHESWGILKPISWCLILPDLGWVRLARPYINGYRWEDWKGTYLS